VSPILCLRSETVLIVEHFLALCILGAQKQRSILWGELGEGRYDTRRTSPHAHLLRAFVGTIFSCD
jgi:hypothetical protein